MKLKTLGIFLALTFLAACSPDFIKTGRSYPALSANSSVKVMLSEQGVKYAEIGLYTCTLSWLGRDNAKFAIEQATGMARHNGGNCVYLKSMIKDNKGNSTFTFVIGRLKEKKEDNSEKE